MRSGDGEAMQNTEQRPVISYLDKTEKLQNSCKDLIRVRKMNSIIFQLEKANNPATTRPSVSVHDGLSAELRNIITLVESTAVPTVRIAEPEILLDDNGSRNDSYLSGSVHMDSKSARQLSDDKSVRSDGTSKPGLEDNKMSETIQEVVPTVETKIIAQETKTVGEESQRVKYVFFYRY